MSVQNPFRQGVISAAASDVTTISDESGNRNPTFGLLRMGLFKTLQKDKEKLCSVCLKPIQHDSSKTQFSTFGCIPDPSLFSCNLSNYADDNHHKREEFMQS